MKLKSVNILTIENDDGSVTKAAEVMWRNIETLYDADSNPVSVDKGNHRASYSSSDKEQFLNDVENAAAYIPLLGW